MTSVAPIPTPTVTRGARARPSGRSSAPRHAAGEASHSYGHRFALLARDGGTEDLGQPVDFQVSCWRSDRGVMADTTITFANGTLGLRIGFVPSGQVSGLSLLSPPR